VSRFASNSHVSLACALPHLTLPYVYRLRRLLLVFFVSSPRPRVMVSLLVAARFDVRVSSDLCFRVLEFIRAWGALIASWRYRVSGSPFLAANAVCSCFVMLFFAKHLLICRHVVGKTSYGFLCRRGRAVLRLEIGVVVSAVSEICIISFVDSFGCSWLFVCGRNNVFYRPSSLFIAVAVAIAVCFGLTKLDLIFHAESTFLGY